MYIMHSFFTPLPYALSSRSRGPVFGVRGPSSPPPSYGPPRLPPLDMVPDGVPNLRVHEAVEQGHREALKNIRI